MLGDLGEGPKKAAIGLNWILSVTGDNSVTEYLNEFYLEGKLNLQLISNNQC